MKSFIGLVAVVSCLWPRVGLAQAQQPPQPPQLTRVSCSVTARDLYGAPAAGIRVTVAVSGVSASGVTNASGSVTVSTGRVSSASDLFATASCSIGAEGGGYFPLRGELFFRDEVPPGSFWSYRSDITVTPKPDATRHVGVGDADLFQSGAYDKPIVIAQPFFTDEPVQGRMSAGRLWREYNGNPALLTETRGFLTKLKTEGYDVWLFRPRSIGDNIYDQATDFARAVQVASGHESFNRPVVAAGFSLGGLIVRAALSRWGFDPTWRAQNGLAATPPVSLIVALDAPLRGALVNRDLQHAFWNASFDGDGQSAHDHNMDTCATQQMLEYACHKIQNDGTALECNDRGWFETYVNGGSFKFCNPNQGSCGLNVGAPGPGVKTCSNPTGIGLVNQPNGGWPLGIKKIAATLGLPYQSTGICYGDASGLDRTGELRDGCPQADLKRFGRGELWGYLSITGTNRDFRYDQLEASADSWRHHFVDELTPGSRQPGTVESVQRTKFIFFQVASGHQILHAGTFIPVYSALDQAPGSGVIPFDEYWTNSYSAFHDALTDIEGNYVNQRDGSAGPLSLIAWLLRNLAIALPAAPPTTPPTGACGEATCVPAQGAYLSHFSGPACTGNESYYLPYDGFGYSCRTWDGQGQCGTLTRIATNVSYKYNNYCIDAWPSGNTLSDFVTVYRADVGQPTCGEASCVPAQAAYASHFTGPDCTGTESYYLPYDRYAYTCRPWNGTGQCGTIRRTVTNVSGKYQGQCVNAWPEGNTLSDFVTVYRGGQ